MMYQIKGMTWSSSTSQPPRHHSHPSIITIANINHHRLLWEALVNRFPVQSIHAIKKRSKDEDKDLHTQLEHMSGVGVGFVEVYLDPGNRFRREAGELEEATVIGERKRSSVSGFLNGLKKSAFSAVFGIAFQGKKFFFFLIDKSPFWLFGFLQKKSLKYVWFMFWLFKS